MTAYYNEFDPKAAAWLRELIAQGHIASGVVDERSIEDVTPADLAGFTQCHFFAGIGVWSYALRCARWPDDRPVWTGSCPCQPFSAAGKGGGFADERHLWPAFHWLIEQCRPPVVFGEQVASKDGLGWLDLVQADLEGTGYASRAVDLCAAGVGAPHIRQRLWWVAERLADPDGRGRQEQRGRREQGWATVDAAPRSEVGLLEHPGSLGRIGRGPVEPGGRPAFAATERSGSAGLLEYASGDGRVERRPEPSGRGLGGLGDDDDDEGLEGQRGGHHAPVGRDGQVRPVAQAGELGRPGPTNGVWRSADWLFCRDGKWRPVEPGTFPLAHGAAARVGRLRGYGNAIVAPAAQAFIEAFEEARLDRLRLTELYGMTTDDLGVFG